MPNLYLQKEEGNGYWDISIDDQTRRITGTEQVAQLVKSRLQTLRGEWEKDKIVGVPWLDDVFIKNYSLVLVESYIAKTIISTNGVKKLNSISSVPDRVRRKLAVTFSATSIYDEDFDSSVQL